MNSSLNADVAKTYLDGVFYQTYNVEMTPGIATALDAMLFKQDSADSSRVIMDLFSGVGDFDETAEEQNVSLASPRFGQTKTMVVTKFTRGVDVPDEFFRDSKFSAIDNMVQSLARRAKTKRDKNAFSLFRNYSTTTLTSDSVAWGSASHVNLAGDTVSNLITPALSDSGLNTAMTALMEQKSQDSEIDGHTGTILVVPPALQALAFRITQSKLRQGTANNDLNYYSDIHPGLRVFTSPYLGAAAGGSDTAWFLLSEGHSVTRFVREGVSTSHIPATMSRNDVHNFRSKFREVCDVLSYEGSVISNATT